jgi:hypothetical protein
MRTDGSGRGGGVRRMDCVFYRDGGGFRATDEQDVPLDEVYHMGVIDILTPYDWRKRIEHRFKALTHDRVRRRPQLTFLACVCLTHWGALCMVGQQHFISAVSAGKYAARFVRFLTDATLPPEAATASAVPVQVTLSDPAGSSSSLAVAGGPSVDAAAGVAMEDPGSHEMTRMG